MVKAANVPPIPLSAPVAIAWQLRTSKHMTVVNEVKKLHESRPLTRSSKRAVERFLVVQGESRGGPSAADRFGHETLHLTVTAGDRFWPVTELRAHQFRLLISSAFRAQAVITLPEAPRAAIDP